MISFLSPWLWVGVLAVGAPIWLHLRRKEREKIVYFAALRFLEDQPIARKSPLELKSWPLFLLRLLALLLLIAAFCQPFLRNNLEAVSSSDVYILDNTLSRQADQGLERDRNFILQKIRDAGPHQQIAVVELSDEPRVVTGFGDSSVQATAKLNALQPTASRGMMVAALRQADSLLKQSLGEVKHITVLSDQQANQWTENANTPPFLTPGQVTLSSFSDVESRPNFFVCEPKTQRIFLGSDSLVLFTALIGHTGKVNSAVVKLTANDHEIINQPIELDDNTAQRSVLSKWEADPSVWLQGAITVEAKTDDLPQDNTVYFTIPPVTEGKVALLSHSVYLQTALSDSVARGLWTMQRIEPAKISEALSAPADSDADVLMIDGNYLQSADARSLVNRYLQNGRGVFMMVGETSTLSTGFLEGLGFDPKEGDDDAAPKTLKPIRYFAPESPIFQPFLTPDFSNLMEVRVGRSVPLTSKSAKPLLFSADGDGLLFEGNKGTGRFLLSTFAFNREQTDWVVHPSFVPFIDLALQRLRPQPTLNNTLEPGETWLISIPAGRQVKTVVLHDKDKELARADVNADRHATIRAPGQPGLYSLTYDDGTTVEQMLAVNPPEKESDLTYLKAEPPLLKSWTLSGQAETHPQTTQALVPATTQASRQNLWWKLLVAGFAALFLETVFLSKRGQNG